MKIINLISVRIFMLKTLNLITATKRAVQMKEAKKA